MLELERYELFAGPAYRFEPDIEPDRRDFFKILGGGIVVMFALSEAEAQESGRAERRGGGGNALPKDIGAWLHIGENGRITAFTGKVEVGQNARTSLTQAVSEELCTAPETISLVMGDTDLTPFDMGTFGSRTTPTMAPQLRRAAAAARELLLDLAADQWKADRSTLKIENGRVSDPLKGKTAGFGELTKSNNLVKTIDGQAITKPRSESVAKVDARAMVTGAHRFTSDMHRPGMVHGKVLRAPAVISTLVSVDTKAAGQIAGVQVVHDGDFVGVCGPDEQSLSRALASIKAEWKTGPQPSSKELFAYLKANPESDRAARPLVRGSMEDGLSQADHKLEASYTVAYIAHVPLEPRAALAEWEGGKLTVWTGSQRPFGVRTELAEAFKIPENRIRVIVPDTGSGYGGKHTGECAIEAARLAKTAGKPVKLAWTREEEFTWAYFRPAGVIDVRSGVRKDGTITAWEFHNFNSGPSGIATPYDVPNQHVEFHSTKYPLRQGSYRGLAATANHFARESHMDELARAAGMDPLAFRYKNLKDERLRAVLEAACEKFGWGRQKASAARGFGLACGLEKGSYVATCAEISVADGGVKIEHVVTAFECGAIVNPDHLKNQVEGAAMMAIGGAMFETVSFENGKILNAALSRYRVPRFSDMPAIEAVLVDRKDLDSAGAGETPIVALAPAVANAIFSAGGKRIRSMPMNS
ncbi:MAG: molybdopterin-dependent oxidoreductase [Acidobacteriota bacterium]|nr:molybdopterin-dependent oxidoreductase [Acidobacteriota bacterium]